MKLVERPSPNYDKHDERGDAVVDMLVLHYTGMQTAEAALERLCDPDAKVSAHYTVDEAGTVYAHVPETAAPGMPVFPSGRASPTSMPARSASNWSIRAMSSAIAHFLKRRSPA